jgi:hypothetical protein
MDDDERGAGLRTVATWLAAVSIVLVFANGALALRDQEQQRDVSQRQQAINQSAALGRVSQLLIEAVAKSAVTNKDDTLTQLLAQHGIKINANPGQAPAPAAAPAPAETKP